MKKLTIAVDLDSTVADLWAEWLGLYQEEYDEVVSVADMKSWDAEDNVKIGHEIYKYLEDPFLYRRLYPYPGAVEALQRLHDAGHDIHIVSAPSKHEQTAADKIWWCRQHLPFVKRQKITLSHAKGHFLCDVFIDDSPRNIEDHLRKQPQSYRLGIAFPYNNCVRDYMDLRAESWADTKAAWEEMEDFITRIADGEIRRE